MSPRVPHILKPALFVLLLLLQFLNAGAQAISPRFFGQNAWMPDTIGSNVLNGKIHTKWSKVAESGVKTVRFGGISADRDRPTNFQYIKMIDSIRARGMEPIIQVSYHDGDYTASQAAQLVQYINGTRGRNILYWIIGNEPDLEYGYTSAAQVAAYIKPFASAMKAVDPSIKIIGPETAWYNQSILHGLTTPGGPSDITGVDTAGRYYVDIISFHTYPFNGTQTRASMINKLTANPGFDTYLGTLSARIASCNATHGRSGASAIKMAVTEANVNYQNSSTDNLYGTGVNSFVGGQFVAEMYGIGMKNGLDIMTMWSVVEGNSTALNIGYLDRTTGNKKPAYHHLKMMAEHFSGNYISSTSTQTNVKVFSSQNSSVTTVLIMNQDTATNYSYAVRLNTALITATNALKINVNANIAQNYYNVIPNQSSVLLQFNAQGAIVKKVTYTIAQALANLSPTVSVYTPTVPLAITPPANNTSPLLQTLCSGYSTTLSAASGTNTVQWFISMTSTAPVASGTAFVTGTLAASSTPTVFTYYAQASTGTNVSLRTPVSVTVNPRPVVTVNSGSACAGNSFTMIPSGATSYTFSNGSAVVSPTVTSSYSVSGSNGYGCFSAPAITTVTVHAKPVVSAPGGSICQGSTFTISPSGAGSYTFSGGSAVVSPSATTGYSVTGKSGQGCISSPAIVQVTVYSRPALTVNSGTICAGQFFTITPAGAASYTIAGNSSVVSPTSTSSFTVSGTSAAGCLSSAPAIANVTVHALPVVSVNNGTVCSGQPFVMTPSGAASYSFSSGSATVVPTSGINYSVTGTSTAGCISAQPAIALVTVNALPVITVNSGTICAGSAFTMLPSGALTYSFSSGSSTVTPGSSTSYTIRGTDGSGCLSLPVVSNVTVNTVNIMANSGAICSGESFTLNPTGAVSYTFSSGTPIVSPASTATYLIKGTSAQGCVSAAFAISTVTVHAKPVITVNSGSICSGSSFTLAPAGAASYTVAGASFVVSPLASTFYSITGTSIHGCKGGAFSKVVVQPQPIITVSSGTICKGGAFTLTPSGATSYTYSSGSPVVTPLSTTSYSVWGSKAGCTGKAAVAVVNVKDKRNCNTGLVNDLNLQPVSQDTISVAGNLYGPDTSAITTAEPGTETTGITGQVTPSMKLTVYPNPSNGELFIEVEKESHFSVTSISGIVVRSGALSSGTSQVSIADLPAGIYVIRVTQEGRVQTARVIRQ